MQKAADVFHKEYDSDKLWEKTSWLGVPTWKLPFDAWIVQELIYKIRPDFIVETGTAYCGSALFYASIMKLLDHGKVITVDKQERDFYYKPPATQIIASRVTQLIGDSTDQRVVNLIKDIVDGGKCLVILDSWHCKDHVLKELELYSPLVGVGSYIIVEDTHVNGHPIEWEWGEGPYEAVQEFLNKHHEFVIDKECEKLRLTFNPDGFLRRI